MVSVAIRFLPQCTIVFVSLIQETIEQLTVTVAVFLVTEF